MTAGNIIVGKSLIHYHVPDVQTPNHASGTPKPISGYRMALHISVMKETPDLRASEKDRDLKRITSTKHECTKVKGTTYASNRRKSRSPRKTTNTDIVVRKVTAIVTFRSM